MVLLLQLGLSGYFYSRPNAGSDFKPSEPLLASSIEGVDEVVVSSQSEGKSAELKLIKGDKGWVLPAYFDIAVAPSKMTTVVEGFKDLKKSWPLGRTSIAAKQFKVTDEAFERKLEFKQAGKVLHTVYLGTSPSFKKVHVRVDDDKDTYSIKFNNFELPILAKEWADKNILNLERSKVKEISLAEVTLSNKGGDFIPSNLSENEETNTPVTSKLAGKVLNMTYQDVLGQAKDVKLGTEVFRFTVAMTEGPSYEYKVYQSKAVASSTSPDTEPEGDGKNSEVASFALVRSDLPFAFKIDEASYLGVKEVKLSELKKDKASKAADKEDVQGKDAVNDASVSSESDTVSSNP